jgi:hypothetical protein
MINIHLVFTLCIRSSSSLALLYLKYSPLFSSTSTRRVLGSLPIPRQCLGSLLSDGVPPGSEIQTLPANSAALAHTRTVRFVRQDPAPAPGRGPSGPWPRTVRASAESTAAGSYRSDLHPDRRQQCEDIVKTKQMFRPHTH